MSVLVPPQSSEFKQAGTEFRHGNLTLFKQQVLREFLIPTDTGYHHNPEAFMKPRPLASNEALPCCENPTNEGRLYMYTHIFTHLHAHMYTANAVQPYHNTADTPSS